MVTPDEATRLDPEIQHSCRQELVGAYLRDWVAHVRAEYATERTLIEAAERDGVLVVDSRLTANGGWQVLGWRTGEILSLAADGKSMDEAMEQARQRASASHVRQVMDIVSERRDALEFWRPDIAGLDDDAESFLDTVIPGMPASLIEMLLGGLCAQDRDVIRAWQSCDFGAGARSSPPARPGESS